MSLEDAVNRLAAAIEKHTVILEGGIGKAQVPAQPEAPKRGRPTLSTTPKAQAAAASPDPSLNVTGTAPSSPSVSGVKYDTLREAVLKLAETQGHTAGLAVLKPFGVSSAKALREDQWPAAYKAVMDKLNSGAAGLA